MSAYLPHISAFVLICLIAGFFYAARWLLEQYLPPSHEEISQREAERIAKKAKKANKEFKQRQRLRVVRFWNIFN